MELSQNVLTIDRRNVLVCESHYEQMQLVEMITSDEMKQACVVILDSWNISKWYHLFRRQIR